ncbi:hypothetical protein F5Y14DRAFT_461674 [Nemania sp. NC0429]|nr:hypothetical protein F5Y14DRAFT_461674 [Nemania sp. NC0429]
MSDYEHTGHQTTEWASAALSRIKLHVPCQFCSKLLSLHHPADNVTAEAYTILPCGHAFGYDCVWNWLQHNPHCPTCNTSAKHQCGHMATLEKKQQIRKSITVMAGPMYPLSARCDDCWRRESQGGQR